MRLCNAFQHLCVSDNEDDDGDDDDDDDDDYDDEDDVVASMSFYSDV